MSQLSPFLSFDTSYIGFQHQLNVDYYTAQEGGNVRGWGMGKLYNSRAGAVMSLSKSKVRTPGQYTVTDPKTGEPTAQKLQNTQETIHACVRTRNAFRGKGIDDNPGPYESAALKGWKCTGTAREGNVRWGFAGAKAGGAIVLQEDRLGTLELELLSLSSKEYRAAALGE